MWSLFLLAPKAVADSGWSIHINPDWIVPFVVGVIIGAIIWGKATR
jgi:hypothetical protein